MTKGGQNGYCFQVHSGHCLHMLGTGSKPRGTQTFRIQRGAQCQWITLFKPFCVLSQFGRKRSLVKNALNHCTKVQCSWNCCWHSPGLPLGPWALKEAKLPTLGILGGAGRSTCYEELRGSVCGPQQETEGCQGKVKGEMLLRSFAIAQANTQQLGVGFLLLR